MGVLMGCVTSKRPPDAAACLKNMRCPAAYVRRATRGSQGASDVSCRLPSPARAADHDLVGRPERRLGEGVLDVSAEKAGVGGGVEAVELGHGEIGRGAAKLARPRGRFLHAGSPPSRTRK